MSSVCVYFQVHQPPRLKPYTYFQVGRDHAYFDERLNCEIVRRVAQKCYLPANETILRLIRKHGGRFRVAYSITGVVIEQLAHCAPEVVESFQALADTGCVEFLGETYYHSLAAIFDEREFRDQVEMHSQLMERTFGVRPRVFRNTELVYRDDIGRIVEGMGYKGILAEGADDILLGRTPNSVYRRPGGEVRLLLKNYRWSDDIAFRFSNRGWAEYPLTAEKFASWIHGGAAGQQSVNLFMDYETFGEHQWAATGIFDFLEKLPGELLKSPGWELLTPSQVIDRYNSAEELSFPRHVSWADLERDITAWRGNHMQKRALEALYELRELVRAKNNPMTLDLWRKLQTSDHFYYMCTKGFADGDVHAYFNPYRSPYEAFINYMNVITDFKESVLAPVTFMQTTA